MNKLFTCAQTGLERDFAAERKRELARVDAIKRAAQGLRAHEIARICARHELESDEFSTAKQKAERILRARA